MKFLWFCFFILLTGSCANHSEETSSKASKKSAHRRIVTEDYELIIPEKQEALLVLFPCMPCNAENTKQEFNIVDLALNKNITLLLMNFNNRLWLTVEEKGELVSILINAVDEHALNSKHVYMGGFSSGGNVSLLLTDYLKASGSKFQPEGVFIVDSPIDLHALKESALQTIERNFSAPAVAEANWIMDMSARDFGEGDSALVHYEKRSPYSSRTKSNLNISNLEGVKVKLYTEPDTTWWVEEKRATYENMNACYIEQMAADLRNLYGSEAIELIKTENRGFRANGMRHPHSWSIVDEAELVKWVLD